MKNVMKLINDERKSGRVLPVMADCNGYAQDLCFPDGYDYGCGVYIDRGACYGGAHDYCMENYNDYIGCHGNGVVDRE